MNPGWMKRGPGAGARSGEVGRRGVGLDAGRGRNGLRRRRAVAHRGPGARLGDRVLSRRWLILGAGGAGKTTFALELGRILGLPVVHLDRHYWRPGWVEPAPEEWSRQVADLCREEAWILDGNYSRTLGPRLARAQVAVLLDPPVTRCLWGVFERAAIHGRRTRPDLADGCRERLPDLQFLRYIATYKWRSRPHVLRRLAQAPHVEVHHLRSRRDAEAFLDGLRR